MAQFFKAKAKTTSIKAIRDAQVHALDHHLKGVVKHQGQAYFVDGVLPGERVDLLPSAKSGPAKLLKRLSESSQRVKPACQFYQQCGGCSAQHLSSQAQREYKLKAVGELISRLSGYQDLPEFNVLSAEDWHYRRATRLSTWFDKQHGWQLGFRQKSSKQIVAISECLVLKSQLSALLLPLQQLVKSWPKSAGLGHVELIDCQPQIVCRIRLSKAPSDSIKTSLLDFAKQHELALAIATDEESSYLVGEQAYYILPEQNLRLAFTPGDFIQVNEAMNQAMVSQALAWLKPSKEDQILDLYAGIGNFSLALAQQAQHVIAVEGVAAMSKQVLSNAEANGLTNISAFSGDLEQAETAKAWQKTKINKVLLDPARAGAKLAISQVAKLSPSTVVYVSCNPATLARDAKVLKQAGYRLSQLALVDMFAHTEHVETMALFER
ncbi:23S rRNA (uracil(1939)-C(5))-methyltransferase RlmD [Agarivorans aestuarii]|uniref:23S rRNA (Uracil(1939)-C(5))-methyltransferase RlmD n=1 Tax=Agarivorans aestuarii TaxID=1563703 RepID=A0ABU7G5C9_9ALTE|nr:23S rRNA (uracil(1939)-C(5))-methyltransferase RlmD [Agarivorans aestuarii]MEE1674441.1 23S rRNA (uracil(1939)-C(5))-methyltransferase RlmD [Agarivorans aestuarii]